MREHYAGEVMSATSTNVSKIVSIFDANNHDMDPPSWLLQVDEGAERETEREATDWRNKVAVCQASVRGDGERKRDKND